MREPSVSVVIPTFNRPASLAACLSALRQQTLADDLEVIVVDDGSRHGQADSVVAATFPQARLLRQERRGPAAARNAGAAVARAGVLCFTDDDTRPAPDWAQRLLAAIRWGADAAAGRTLAAPGVGRLATASQTIANHLAEDAFGRSDAIPFATSNNLACRREVLAGLPFDPAFGAAGGEDRDWCARLDRAGYSLVFAADALLLHCQVLDLRGFWGQHVRYGRGAYRYRRTNPAAGRLERPAFYAKLLQKAFRQGLAVGGLVSLAQIATAAGISLEALEARLAYDGRRRRPIRAGRRPPRTPPR